MMAVPQEVTGLIGAAAPPASRVLCVEDDPATRRLLAALLGAHGHAVHCCASGEQALRDQTERPLLAILDQRLPGMWGHEVALQLRQRFPRLPVLFATAEIDTAAIVRACPDAVILPKPIHIDTLLGIVAGYAAGAPHAAPGR